MVGVKLPAHSDCPFLVRSWCRTKNGQSSSSLWACLVGPPHGLGTSHKVLFSRVGSAVGLRKAPRQVKQVFWLGAVFVQARPARMSVRGESGRSILTLLRLWPVTAVE